MNDPTTFEAHDDIKNICNYVATIGRYKFYGLDREFLPPPSNETATVSFIEVNSKCYAITARHVIEIFRNLANAEGREYEGYMCFQSPSVAILGPFLTPPSELLGSTPDIEICPIQRDLCLRIGKKPFKVLPQYDAIWPISYAVAVGFPTELKFDQMDEIGRTYMAMTCVHAVAESVSADGSGDQVQFYSELNKELETKYLSGISGGPVFWSNAERYGLLGFVKEALDKSSGHNDGNSPNTSRVHFLCQRADFCILEKWTNYIDENWQNERGKINAVIKAKIRAE